MAHLRGVFIAPSTINRRAHRRSKSHSEVPLTKTESFKSEYSHFPFRDGARSSSPNVVPSLPKSPKEIVTLEFKPVYNSREAKDSAKQGEFPFPDQTRTNRDSRSRFRVADESLTDSPSPSIAIADELSARSRAIQRRQYKTGFSPQEEKKERTEVLGGGRDKSRLNARESLNSSGLQVSQSAPQSPPLYASILVGKSTKSGITVVHNRLPFEDQFQNHGTSQTIRVEHSTCSSSPPLSRDEENEDSVDLQSHHRHRNSKENKEALLVCTALESADLLEHNNHYLQHLLDKKEFWEVTQSEKEFLTLAEAVRKSEEFAHPQEKTCDSHSDDSGFIESNQIQDLSDKQTKTEVNFVEKVESTTSLCALDLDENKTLEPSENRASLRRSERKPEDDSHRSKQDSEYSGTHVTPSYQDYRREAWEQFAYNRTHRRHSFDGYPLSVRESDNHLGLNYDEFTSSVSYQLRKIQNVKELLDAAMATAGKTYSMEESKELWESKETIKLLNDNLVQEKKMNDSKEKTIRNLKQEIKLLDLEISEKNQENKELTENMYATQAKTMSMETENRILENQVRMMEVSNKNLYKELHETRSKLRTQENKVEELKIQKSESARKLAQVLQSSLDRNTRFSFFLHQLEADVASRESAQRKARMEREAAMENILAVERIRKSGYASKSMSQPDGITNEEKEALRAKLDRCFESSSPEVLERVMRVAETGITEGLSVRLDAKDDAFNELQKKIDIARDHFRALKNAEVKGFEGENRLEEKIRMKRKAIGADLTELTKELSAAEIMKKEQESKLENVRKFSNADTRIQSLSLMRRESRDEIADIQSAIRSMESRSQATRENMSEQEKEILSLNQKISKTIEEKAELAEELLLAQSSLQAMEQRYNEKDSEAVQLDRELELKRQEVRDMEQGLQVALDDMTNMMIKLDTANDELELKEKKLRELAEGKDNTNGTESDSGLGEEYRASLRDSRLATKPPATNGDDQGDEDHHQNLKEELVETLLVLEAAQVERQEALKQNEELTGELQKRELENSALVLALEEMRQTQPTPPPPGRLSELWNTIQETTQEKQDGVETHKHLEQELIVKQREMINLKSALSKQQEQNDQQLELLESYKTELESVNEELEAKDKAGTVFTDDGEESSDRREEADSAVISAQSEDITVLQEDVQKLQQVLALQLEESQNYKDQVAKLKESLIIAREAKDCTLKRNRDLSEQIQRKDAKIEHLTSALRESSETPQQANNDGEAAMIEELQGTAERTHKKCQYLESRLNDMKNELDEKERVIIGLQAERDALTSVVPLDTSTPTKTTGQKNNREDDQNQDEDKKVTVVGLKQELQILNTQLSIRDRSIESKINEIYEKDALIRKLQDAKNAERQALSETITKLEGESEILRSENTLLENEASDTVDGIGLRDENVLLRRQINELSYGLAVKRAESEDLHQELVSSENKCAHLEEALARVECIKEELESTTDDLNFQKTSQEKEIELLRKKIEIVEEEMKLTATHTQLLDAVDSRPLAEENEALKTQITEITLQMVLNREELQKVHQELGESETKRNTLESNISALNKKKSDLENEVDDLSFQKNTQHKELELLRKKMEFMEEEIRITEKDLTQKAEQMKKKEVELRRLLDDSSAGERKRQSLESALKNAEQTTESSVKAKESSIEQLTGDNSDLRAEISKLKMDSTQTRYEQRRLERDLSEMRDRFRDSERKFGIIKGEKGKTEDELRDTKKRMVQYQNELSDARSDIRQKEDVIRKLNHKNTELQTLLVEKDESLRREERLRMENMKALDAMKVKLGRVEGDEKKQKDRLFSLKSACSEANEAYEIVKKQNLALRHDMEELKKQLSDRSTEMETNKREKERLKEQILNASRTIDDIRKYSNRDESMSPDSALGISLESLGDLSSGPNSPNSDVSDTLFVAGDEGDLKFGDGQDQNGLLCKMPTMIESFRAVVRDNETMRGKLLELITYKQKSDNQLDHYTSISEDLKKDMKSKDMFLEELQDKSRMLEDELHDAKSKLYDVERNFAATASEAELVKTTLQVREETVGELREKVELLEEKEKALELYSKSISEKFDHEASEKKKIARISETLQNENLKQKDLLKNLEQKLSDFAEHENRMASKITITTSGESGTGATDVAMVTLEGKLDMIVKHSEALETSLTAVHTECSNLQSENERLLREMVERDLYNELVAKLDEQDRASRCREGEFEEMISDLERQREALEKENKEKEESIVCWVRREEELLDDMKEIRMKFSPVETANEIFKAEIEALKESSRQSQENRTKLDSEVKSTKAKMCEMEITNEAYKEENDRLRTEIIALSEEKCEVECKVSEVERQGEKLNEVIKHERAQRTQLEAEHAMVINKCENLEHEVSKAKENINHIEEEQEKTQKVKDELETKLLELTNENGNINAELRLARKDLGELEDRYKTAVQEEEELRQNLSRSSKDNSKLNNAYEQSQRRKDTAEKDLIEANNKNEDLEAAIEKSRMEKASVLKEIAQKEELIQRMETKQSELDEEKQKFTNELYLSTRKVLSLQLNLESLRNEVSHLGKELRRLIQDSLGREPRDDAEEKSIEAEIEMSLIESEVVAQSLRNSIKTTEKSLDTIRPEAKVTEHEYNNCQRDIDNVHREFAFLKDHLSNFKQSCQKQSDEIRRIKEDLKTKESLLQDTKEQLESLKEENTENKETILQLQGKCTDLETLFAEYEMKAETTHEELVQANQHIASLEGNVSKLEQKKATLEKERLVYQEKIKNLESGVRAAKDETRIDKKRIATLEVEYSEKQGLARDFEKMDDCLTELRLKYDDVIKEREEVKSDLATTREELRQQQMELKNSRKEGEGLKKHVLSEKEARSKVEHDLNETYEILKTEKRSLQEVQRHLAKVQEENAVQEEKVKLLEEAGLTLKKETEVQAIDLKRLRDSLTDTRNQLVTSTNNHEGSDRDRKKLYEDLVHSEEQVKKLQDTCGELLREKSLASDKIVSLNDTMETIVSSHEEVATSLKQELLSANKDLAITRSSLERSQKREEELQEEIKMMEDKIAIIEEKKQEIVEKFWKSQNELSEAEGTIDNLRAENKELKGKCSLTSQKAEKLDEIVHQEREDNEKIITGWNDKMIDLKAQFTRTSDERDDLKGRLEETEESLSTTKEELHDTSNKLSDKEKQFVVEVSDRDSTIDDLQTKNEGLRGELKRTKESFKEACIENSDLRERLSTTEEKLERTESKLQNNENDNVDALAEAQAKLNVVNRMRASNSGERFAELQSSPLLTSSDDEYDYNDDRVDAPPTMQGGSVKDAIATFHRACLSSFNDNRALQDSLSVAKQEIERLEETVNKDRSDIVELKRYLVDSEKKKTKLEEEVKRLRRRLENFKQKSIEMERHKDDELCDLKGERAALEKEQWELKEAIEEMRATLKGVEEERDRYADDLDASRKQMLDAKNEMKSMQQQLDDLQDNLLAMKKKFFELETNEKCAQQLLQEREKELNARKQKNEELQKLYESTNQKKIELYTKAATAEEKVGHLDTIRKENAVEHAAFKDEIRTMNNRITDQERKLARTEKDLEESTERNEELEIQRGSLQASNEILKHQVETTRTENKTLKDVLDKTTADNMNLSKVLTDKSTEKENLETEKKSLSYEKNRSQELLGSTEKELRTAEESLVKSFQENECLKRQMLKVQSTSCADSVKLQTEMGKLKSELESIKKDLADKVKEYNELFSQSRVAEKENEFLKKQLGDTHSREAELKLDYTTTNSKLQSYVLERECWEREVKTVVAEIEHQKNANATKEQRLERLRMRYEQEIGFLSQRVTALERELRVVQEAGEQQRHADEIAAKLAIEAKDMEIDNLRMRLQATRHAATDRSSVVDQMKGQLDERTRQINGLMEQMRVLKDSYHLELASVQADLKCSQMENLLKLKRDMGSDSSFTTSQGTVSDLLEAIKGSRIESERLRKLLANKMKEMKSLKKHILSERSSPRTGSKSYSLYGRDKVGDISVD